MRRFLPLLFVLVACDPGLSNDGSGLPGSVLPAASCEQSLNQDADVVLGHLVGNEFEPISEGSPLPVHAGSQGGYHSDLLVRLTGPGADLESSGGLRLDVDVSGGWTENRVANLMPECRGLGSPGYYAQVRLFWYGPPVEEEEEEDPVDCGDNPCEDDPTSIECEDYLDCLDDLWEDEWEDDDWEDEGPSIGWSELTSQTVTIATTVSTEQDELSTVDTSVELVQGEYEEGDG